MLYVQNQEIVICCCIHLTTRSIDEGTWLKQKLKRFCALINLLLWSDCVALFWQKQVQSLHVVKMIGYRHLPAYQDMWYRHWKLWISHGVGKYQVPNSASGNRVLISVILEVMMIAVKDDGCQQEQAILHKARGAVAEVPSAPQPSKPWCLKPWNNLATQRRPHPQSTRTALDEAAPLGTASSQSYINHSASNGINGDSQAADIDMLYDGYFRGLFPAENGRSNEASTSQTNEVRWFPAGGEFGQTIVMMVWHFVSELVEDYNFNFY